MKKLLLTLILLLSVPVLATDPWYVTSSVAISTAAMSTGTAKTVTSISLGAGTWNVTGNVVFNPAGGANTTDYQVSISQTDNTQAATNLRAGWTGGSTAPQDIFGLTAPPQQFTLGTTTIIYLIGFVTFGAGTYTAGGQISAQRVR